MAVGNPLGMDYSVTTGVVSAIERDVVADGKSYSVIQTDAAINTGNSGGALINEAGEFKQFPATTPASSILAEGYVNACSCWGRIVTNGAVDTDTISGMTSAVPFRTAARTSS